MNCVITAPLQNAKTLQELQTEIERKREPNESRMIKRGFGPRLMLVMEVASNRSSMERQVPPMGAGAQKRNRTVSLDNSISV